MPADPKTPPMESRTYVHVAPLPDGHVSDLDCHCAPIPSATVGGGQLVVHRTEPVPLDLPRGDRHEATL